MSGNYFSLLGVQPVLGRAITPEEDQVLGRDPVLVLSHALWQRRFGGYLCILGQSIIINGRSYTVLGIAPAGFYSTDHGIVSEFWVPRAMAEKIMPDFGKDDARTKRDNQGLLLNACLKTGMTRPQAAAVNVIKRRIDDTYFKDQMQYQPPITLNPGEG